jgi:hypothetical protein
VTAAAPGNGSALRRRLLLAAAASLWPIGRWARADDAPLESSVKAAYLYKFLAYVEWPAAAFQAPDTPIVLGISGAEAVLSELVQLLKGRQVHGRPTVARRVNEGDATDGLHVLYVGHASRPPPSAWLGPVGAQPVLLVTDAPWGMSAGSMINFISVQGRVRFEASIAAADRAGIKLSSRLLSVAERVVAAR